MFHTETQVTMTVMFYTGTQVIITNFTSRPKPSDCDWGFLVTDYEVSHLKPSDYNYVSHLNNKWP